MKKLSILLCAIFISSPILADEEIDVLRQQVKMLESRINELEKKQQDKAISDSLPKNNNVLNVGDDKKNQVKLSGYIQADGRNFIDGNSSNSDQFLIRSARPSIDVKLQDNFSARMMFEFGNGQSSLVDAFGDYNNSPEFNIKIGKFKLPIGIERWQSEQNLLFVERGMTNNLVPFRDNGIEIYGSLLEKAWNYQVALSNSAPDLVNSNNGSGSSRMLTTRIFSYPFLHYGNDYVKNIGIGLAASFSNNNTSLGNPNLTSGYVSPSQAKFFNYSNNAFANGKQIRINPQFTYYKDQFGLMGEYIKEKEDVSLGNFTSNIDNSAWSLITSYVLTGEDARFDGVIPRNDFNIKNGNFGAFEIAARISQMRIDDKAFPILASLNASAKAADEFTLGFNWYLNQHVKFNLDFSNTDFTGGDYNNRDRKTEKAVLSRAQVKF